MKLLARDYCKFTGITEESWYDETTGTLTLRRLQDVEHNINFNKALKNSYTSKKPNYKDSDGLHHIAKIPFMVVEKWLRETGFNWYSSSDKERRAKLNENPDLLVRPGRL